MIFFFYYYDLSLVCSCGCLGRVFLYLHYIVLGSSLLHWFTSALVSPALSRLLLITAITTLHSSSAEKGFLCPSISASPMVYQPTHLSSLKYLQIPCFLSLWLSLVWLLLSSLFPSASSNLLWAAQTLPYCRALTWCPPASTVSIMLHSAPTWVSISP